MGLNTVYKAKSFDLSDLKGISNETLAMHFKLYEGYVTNTNTLNEKIAELIKDGELDATKTAAFGSRIWRRARPTCCAASFSRPPSGRRARWSLPPRRHRSSSSPVPGR